MEYWDCLYLLLPVIGYLTDAGTHAPPTSGTYDYNAFKPGAGGFPAVGNTYVDPIFTETVRRLTDVTGGANADDIYAFHWANADGTYAFHTATVGGLLKVINTMTGADVYTSQPGGLNASECRWHPTDPDKYYYLNGTDLVRRNLVAQTNKLA